jgi:hypothetical protein
MTALPPRPVGDQDTQPFWDAASERRLVVPRCGSCGRWIWQPRPLCPGCHTPDPDWAEVSGSGVVTSWTVIHPPVLPAWAEDVPFTVVLVELEQGVRMVGRLVDADPSALSIGAPVVLRWREEAGAVLPAWTLAP